MNDVQRKKPRFKALLIITALCLFWSFKPAFSKADNSFVSPIPNYNQPQVKGESTNDNPGGVSFANSGYPLVGLAFGSGVVSGVAIYKKRKQKNAEEIDFIDPQTN